MSDRTQDLKNLRAVATACKNYVDETKEQILWQVGQYNITTQDDNTTAYQKVVPTGATRGKLKSIDGMSCKSENLATFDDEAETTINGVKVKYQDGGIYLDGTANAQFKIAVQFKQPIYANKDYYVKLFTSGTTTATNPKAIGETSTDVRLLVPSTTTFNVAYNINYFWFSVGANSVWTNYVVKPMIVKGTTEPTEWKQGYSGIHNFEWNGIKVECENILGIVNKTQTTTSGITYKVENGSLYLNGTAETGLNLYFDIDELYLNGTFYYKEFTSGTLGTWARALRYGETNIQNLSNPLNFTISNETVNRILVYIPTGSTFTNAIITPMLVRGSVAPTQFVPYETPITKTIDLSTILYNGNPLFEGNSLKAVGTAKDYITPYKAHKELGYIDLGTLTWSAHGTGEHDRTSSSAITNAKPNTVSSGTPNILCSKYTTGTPDGAYSHSSDNLITLVNQQVFLYSSALVGMTATQVKEALSGIYLVYELNEYIEADIDFSFLKNIPVYENGTITFENTHQLAVPSNITYRIEVAK